MRYLPVILMCLAGCSAKYWGGEAAGELPGVHWRSPSLLSPAEFSVTSDCDATIGKLQYQGSTKTQPSSVTLEDAKFGQTPSADLPLLPPIIMATTELQRSQAEYAQVWATTIKEVIGDVTNLISVLGLAKIKSTSTGMNLELPGGLKIGGTRVTNPGDITNYLQALQGKLEQLQASAPVTTRPQ